MYIITTDLGEGKIYAKFAPPNLHDQKNNQD